MAAIRGQKKENGGRKTDRVRPEGMAQAATDERQAAVQQALAKAHEGCPLLCSGGCPLANGPRATCHEPRTCCRNCVCAAEVRDGQCVHWVCVNTPERPGCIVCVKPDGKCPHFRARRKPVVRGTPPEPPDDQSRYIPLTRGRFALVDAADYEWLSRWKWCATGKDRLYACRRENGKTIYMHREIMKTPPDMCTDHISGQSLDNRRANLRNCTYAENTRNRRGNSGRSLYKGVTFQAHCGKYKASIGVNRRPKHIGYYDDPIEAARAYDRKAKELFGPYARLNFPDELERESVNACERGPEGDSG